MRLAVYGVGGAGGYFGVQLIRAGEQVSFIARGPHLDAIRRDGLRLTLDDDEIAVRPHLATDDPGELAPVDVVLLGVKAHQVTGLAGHLRHLLADERSFIVPLQNGVETVDALVDAVGERHVLGGLCGTVSWVAEPGRIRSLGSTNFIRFGELDNRRSERTESLRQLFERAGVAAGIPDDIHAAIWEKFLFVVSVGGVAAMHDMTVGELRADTTTRQLLAESMEEIHALAGRKGISLDADLVGRTLSFVDTLPADGTASMQRDIANNKASELEAWNGAVVRLAAEVDLAVPAHQAIYTALRARVDPSRMQHSDRSH